jgi:hypothetical protein
VRPRPSRSPCTAGQPGDESARSRATNAVGTNHGPRGVRSGCTRDGEPPWRPGPHVSVLSFAAPDQHCCSHPHTGKLLNVISFSPVSSAVKRHGPSSRSWACRHAAAPTATPLRRLTNALRAPICVWKRDPSCRLPEQSVERPDRVVLLAARPEHRPARRARASNSRPFTAGPIDSAETPCSGWLY